MGSHPLVPWCAPRAHVVAAVLGTPRVCPPVLPPSAAPPMLSFTFPRGHDFGRSGTTSIARSPDGDNALQAVRGRALGRPGRRLPSHSLGAPSRPAFVSPLSLEDSKRSRRPRRSGTFRRVNTTSLRPRRRRRESGEGRLVAGRRPFLAHDSKRHCRPRVPLNRSVRDRRSSGGSSHDTCHCRAHRPRREERVAYPSALMRATLEARLRTCATRTSSTAFASLPAESPAQW